jgi:hypothetical protein
MRTHHVVPLPQIHADDVVRVASAYDWRRDEREKGEGYGGEDFSEEAEGD